MTDPRTLPAYAAAKAEYKALRVKINAANAAAYFSSCARAADYFASGEANAAEKDAYDAQAGVRAADAAYYADLLAADLGVA